MKKLLYILPFLLLANLAKGQDSVVYKLTLFDKCDSSYSNGLKTFCLIDSEGNVYSGYPYNAIYTTHGPTTSPSESIALYDTGVYMIAWVSRSKQSYSMKDFYDTIYINNYGITFDTIIRPALIRVYGSTKKNWHFMYCGRSAEGPIIEYYPNGNIFFKGTFSKGIPIDTVYEYYYDEQIMSKYFNGKDSLFKVEYYHNGPLKEVTRVYKKDSLNAPQINDSMCNALIEEFLGIPNYSYFPQYETIRTDSNGYLYWYSNRDSLLYWNIAFDTFYNSTNVTYIINNKVSIHYFYDSIGRITYYYNSSKNISENYDYSVIPATKKTFTTNNNKEVTTRYILINGEWIEQKQPPLTPPNSGGE